MNRPPQLRLSMEHELIVDQFAGGGGASLGIEMALGRSPDIAINHDPEAVALHAANHPTTQHFCEDVFKIDPVAVCAGRPVGLMWLSPDCKHFSKAKGGKPVEKKIRGLAWLAVKWADTVQPRIIVLENVEEFQDWGPLTADNMPCPKRKGLTFKRWVRELEKRGYVVEWRELRACDYGAPTIRKRLFLVARCDGLPIAWPEPTHGKGLKPYRTAAECIDWSIPCPSIFERVRPLADNTLKRIAAGVVRYVINAQKPFIVPVLHTGDSRIYSIDEPLRTITGQRRGEQALVAAFMAQHNTGVVGRSMSTPVSTIVGKGSNQNLVASHLIKLRGTCKDGQPVDRPAPTITASGWHVGEVRAFLTKYYGTNQDPNLREPLHTITTKDRFSLVTVEGQPYYIADIGMRMLQPRELYTAQGFPTDFRIEITVGGQLLTKSAQVRMCGNSVSPPVAAAVVAANFSHEQYLRAVA